MRLPFVDNIGDRYADLVAFARLDAAVDPIPVSALHTLW